MPFAWATNDSALSRKYRGRTERASCAAFSRFRTASALLPACASIQVRSALKNDDSKDVREAICFALGRIGPDQKGVVFALTQACQEENEEVRMAATRILAQFGPKAKRAIPALIRRVHDPWENVRMFAAQALGNIGEISTEVLE